MNVTIKKLFFIGCILAMTVFLVVYPQQCLKSAMFGLNLWFTTVLPSLFPFMTASYILVETGIIRLVSFIFAPATRFLFSAPGECAYIFFASAFSGYPMGAALASELYARNQLSEWEAQSIIKFTSTSGPVFIMGAVASGMLGSPESAVYLAAAHYLSAVFTGIIFGLFKKTGAAEKRYAIKDVIYYFRKEISGCRPLGDLLADSAEKAIFALLKIGGLIIFFSVVMEILSLSGIIDAAAFIYSPFTNLSGLEPESTRAALLGGIEMTNGCAIASASPLSLMEKLPVISAIIAFGGICVHMQTRSVCARNGLSLKGFVPAKSIQSFFAFVLCALLMFVLQQGAVPAETKKAAITGIISVAFTITAFIALKILRITKKRASAPP